ncbi:MAG: alkaline phosphatase D family protein [Tunicatimonas sp.]
MRTFLTLFVLSSLLLNCQPSAPVRQTLDTPPAVALDTTQALTTIAFGSCNRQDEPQPMWDDVLTQQPDLWIWLGDNIYGDTEDMRQMRDKYAQQLGQPGYQQLLAAVPVVGTWDDHDYGVNDGGREFGSKQASRDLLLEFLAVPKGRPVWDREGAYQSYTIGPAGQRVKVLLLDTRYFRDALVASADTARRYGANTSGDLLGDDQWRWLEAELRDSDAQVHLIGSSIQVLAQDHGFEKWANFPNSRQRLFDLIADTQAPGVVLLSGDRHIGEIARYDAPGVEYPLYDLTSSGLTHVYEAADEPNRYRVSDLITVLNFGLITIDWRSKPAQLTFQIRGEEGKVLAEEEMGLK